MEFIILNSLRWTVNPPTGIAFVMHMILLLPDQLEIGPKREVLESSRFLTGRRIYVK